ncbi:hypothetical protein ZHAS_00006124 [Anopheles sinensis]|uniref:Uncharacterized protein n=1 Tax=Anopheles sinensis TaxID=74873 RepID=A0A084VL82_ANOSI|nr:hypothetical protein ZHAS_00006124 [Anopheles sinensis]
MERHCAGSSSIFTFPPSAGRWVVFATNRSGGGLRRYTRGWVRFIDPTAGRKAPILDGILIRSKKTDPSIGTRQNALATSMMMIDDEVAVPLAEVVNVVPVEGSLGWFERKTSPR